MYAERGAIVTLWFVMLLANDLGGIDSRSHAHVIPFDFEISSLHSGLDCERTKGLFYAAHRVA